MKIYISGKITGLTEKESRRKFGEAEQFLKVMGYEPVNPFSAVEQSDGMEWEDYMVEDIRHLFGCKGIFMLDNWNESRGARIEHYIAKEMHMKIYYEGAKWPEPITSNEVNK